MKTCSNHLDGRDESRLEAKKRQERGDLPFMSGAPEERLLKFDAWVRAELRERLLWTGTPEENARRIEQCRIALDKPVLELWRRGWLLDGRRLAHHIRALLDAVGTAQRKGSVEDFWPYFRSAVSRYVGANAEEIQMEARSAGAHVGAALASINAMMGAPTEPSIPALIAARTEETLREKMAKQRKRSAQSEAAKSQLKLL